MKNVMKLYVNHQGALVKVIDGQEIVLPFEFSRDLAKQVLIRQQDQHLKASEIDEAINRGFCLEKGNRPITLSDLLPEKTGRGKYLVVVEFQEDV